MQDGPAVATLIFVIVLFVVYSVFAALARRSLRAESRALLTEHLAHWRYPQAEWRAFCERQRRELWFRDLRPAARYLLPALVLVGGLAWIAEQRGGLSGGLATLGIVILALMVANTIIGPSIRSFIRLSRRCALDYELYLGASGALERWRDGERICASEEHSFTDTGGRIERVEANGVDPAEIVFSLAKPLAFGFLHTEARFLVPEGRLAEAREIARTLTPDEDSAEEHSP